MNTKHTPGPWTMRPSQHDERHYAIHAASAMRWVAHVAVENNEANARLIAAAPDLLEALKEALDQLESWNQESEPTFTMRRVAHAIAKATDTTNL